MSSLLPSSSSQPLLSPSSSSSSSSSSSNSNSFFTASLTRRLFRFRSVITFALLSLVTTVVLLSGRLSISLPYRTSAGYTLRTSQQLVGFHEDRFNNLGIPRNLLEYIEPEDLLRHPLLASVPPFDCALRPAHLERYAPMLPGYKKRKSAKYSSLNRRDEPMQYNYLIAINLIDAATVFPSLVRALYSMMILVGGPNGARGRFHISIYENGSKDETPAQLYLLSKLLRTMRVGFTIVSDSAAGKKQEGSRIEALARLRNVVLSPVFDAPPNTYDRILFLNDVHLCETDLMELLFSNEAQDADMSCGMDYKELEIAEFKDIGYPLIFYDTWVARDMAGLPFYKISQPGGGWHLPSDPLPISPSRFRFQSLLPFQVYSCWNGVTVLKASLFLPPYNLRFRTNDGTDIDSECYLICKDVWQVLAPWKWSVFNGEGSKSLPKNVSATLVDGVIGGSTRGARIQVVPRVSVGYTAPQYERARKDRNVTAWDELDGEQQQGRSNVLEREEAVDWSVWPPKRVAHYPYARWNDESWISPL